MGAFFNFFMQRVHLLLHDMSSKKCRVSEFFEGPVPLDRPLILLASEFKMFFVKIVNAFINTSIKHHFVFNLP